MTPRKREHGPRRPGRPPSEHGPRTVRISQPLFYQEEADLIKKVAGHSVSDFIRTATLKEANRLVKKDGAKNNSKRS